MRTNLLAWLLSFLLACSPAWAAIAVDTTFDQSGVGTGATNSETIGGSATLAVMWVELVATSGADCFTNASINSVNYTGLIKQASTSTANGFTYLLWWINPPTGTHSVASAFSCNVNFSQRTATYSGVANQAPVTAKTASSGGSTATFTLSPVTPCAANAWVIGGMENSAASITAGLGTNFRVGSPNGDGLFDTNGAVSVSTSLQGTSSSHTWTGMEAAFMPTTCSPPPATTGLLMHSVP